VEHDSVVARPTFARTVQLDNAPLPDGLHATLPSTVNAKGAVVSKVVHPAFRRGEETQLVGSGVADLTGSFLQGELNEVSSPSVQSRGGRQQQNRIVEIDVPGQQGRNGRASAGSVGFASPAGGMAGGFNKSTMSAGGEPRTGKFCCVALIVLYGMQGCVPVLAFFRRH
jgi:hypothetical protein